MNLKDFEMAPFYDLDKEWALLTVGKEGLFNMMTISWGGFGTLWHKPFATVYIRRSRYTYELLEQNDYYTISFYDAEYRSDLGVLGSKSGRDINKMEETSLTPKFMENAMTFEEAKLTIVCKKIYQQELDINNIPKEYSDRFYENDEIHEMFIGEVVDIIDNRKLLK